MRTNIKQQELIDEMFNKAQKKFPEIKFKNLQESPDDPEHIWINVLADMDEDREIKLMHYAARLDYDILMKYGYKISIMTENPNVIYA